MTAVLISGFGRRTCRPLDWVFPVDDGFCPPTRTVMGGPARMIVGDENLDVWVVRGLRGSAAAELTAAGEF